MFKKILVPFDIGHASESNDIIKTAAVNASDDAEIILLNVVEEIPNWVAVELPKDFQQKSYDESKQALNEIAKASDIKTTAEVRTGHPYQTILDVAKEKSVDLIIIASHKPGLKDYLLGSTAAKVVRHADCAVLVIR